MVHTQGTLHVQNVSNNYPIARSKPENILVAPYLKMVGLRLSWKLNMRLHYLNFPMSNAFGRIAILTFNVNSFCSIRWSFPNCFTDLMALLWTNVKGKYLMPFMPSAYVGYWKSHIPFTVTSQMNKSLSQLVCSHWIRRYFDINWNYSATSCGCQLIIPSVR